MICSIQSNGPIQSHHQIDSLITFKSYTQIDLLLLLWDFSLVFVQFIADNKEHRRKKEQKLNQRERHEKKKQKSKKQVELIVLEIIERTK